MKEKNLLKANWTQMNTDFQDYKHTAQLLNYLKATNIEVGLLLNFGIEPEIRRKAFDNNRKGNTVHRWT